MNHLNELDLVMKNLNICTVTKLIPQSFSRTDITPTSATLHTQDAGTLFGGEERREGQESTCLTVTQNKAYKMVLLRLLFLFRSAVKSVMVNTKKLIRPSADGETIYSPQKTLRTSTRINKEYQQVFHTRELSPVANLSPGPKFTDVEKYSNTSNINLCCLFRLGFNETI